MMTSRKQPKPAQAPKPAKAGWQNRLPAEVRALVTQEQLESITMEEAKAIIASMLMAPVKMDLMSMVDIKQATASAHQHVAWAFIQSHLIKT